MIERTGAEDSTDEDARTDENAASNNDGDRPLPDDVLEEAARLTRLERNATLDAEGAQYETRRDQLLDSYEYTARVRDDDDVLVCHPQQWLDDGTVRPERIEDLSSAVELPLDGEHVTDDWETIDERNRAVAAAVRDSHGDVHGDTASAFADFASNHLAKPIDAVSADERVTFREEYFRRNAWPSDEQRAVIDRSLELLFEVAETADWSTQ